MAKVLPHPLAWRLRALRVAADPASFATMVTLSRRSSSTPVDVRLRPLDGHAVRIRPHTADIWTVLDLLPPVHMPPPEISPPRYVWDLGANIGLTLAHMAVAFPEAELVGVEMDADNAALCRENVAPWANRCRVVEAAVWSVETELSYARRPGDEVGYRVVDGDGQDDAVERRTVRSIRLERLLEDRPPDAVVDYVKMDIEGAERDVLRAGEGWARRVHCITVEVHHPYTVEDCFADLRGLGFEPSSDPRHWVEGRGWPVTGIRRDRPGA